MCNLIRTTCLIALLTLISPAWAEQWETLLDTPNDRLLVDLDSVGASGRHLLVAARLIDRQSEVTQDNVLFAFDCEKRRFAVLESARFVQSGGKIQLQDHQPRAAIDAAPFVEVKPGSYADALFSFTCTWQAMRMRALEKLPLKTL